MKYNMGVFLRFKHGLLAAYLVCCIYVLNSSSFCWSLNDEGMSFLWFLAMLVRSFVLSLSFHSFLLWICFVSLLQGISLLRFKERIDRDPYGALSNWIDEAGVESPCSWSGIECSERGNVVALDLKDLCLRGTLAADIGNLVHVKYVNLRNNSFYGAIPSEVTNLKELEMLDLGYNNFSGQIPCNLCNNFSMTILLLDNNELLGITEPEIYRLQNLSEVQVDERLLTKSKVTTPNFQVMSCSSRDTNVLRRKLLQKPPSPKKRKKKSSAPRPAPSATPISAPSPAPSSEPPRGRSPSSEPPHLPRVSSSPFVDTNHVPPSSSPVQEDRHGVSANSSETKRKLIMAAAIIGPVLLLLLAVGIFLCQSGKVATVRPWATGLSGQLQKAFVTGVPKLKRSELEAACEDFSNVIGSSSICAVYKGTLSSGVEIAVAAIAMNSSKDWSTSLESHFRKKIDTLSKVNHKNFVSLIGYCVEEEPFTRMLVFEYAPNGTLFEHLHIREAEHLDWAMRLRIAMGMAYCLEHMHQLSPPLIHRNLTSSSVCLTEDYASKISDFVFWDEEDMKPDIESNVYNFGVILFEMMTGKLPYAVGNDSIEDWASDYLRGEQPLRDMVDPMLKTYREDQLQEIGNVIKSCVDPRPRQRPNMQEVCARMREITGITPNGAIPKLSPLWWAELEILSTEAN